MNLSLTDTEFSMIREMISSRMGLYFPADGWGVLKYRLSSAAEEAGFQDLSEFIHFLLSARLNADQVELLAPHLTIPETYFWRESNVFNALDHSALKELVASRNENSKTINIWCAGCSTGEEAYSLAIALVRAIPIIEGWKISILATDINSNALAKARTGVYRSWSFRNSPAWFRDLYFNRKNKREYEIIPEIRDMVTFSNFNLTHGDFLSTICNNQKMDIIFCRNVLMYLTKTWAAKVSQNFYDSLLEGGWLVVASCELSTELFPMFTTINFPGAILYRKPADESSVSVTKFKESVNHSIFNNMPSLSPEHEETGQLSINSDHHNSALHEKSPGETGRFIRPAAGMSDAMIRKTRIKIREEILHEKKISILSLANHGHLEEALSICNEAIESDKLARSLYFLRASILQEMEKSDDAIKSLKQALFIDPDYIAGHFTLANLFKKLGNIKNARRHFINALRLLNNLPDEEIPEESGGISAEYMRLEIIGNLQINIAI
jgi:chemotaxis protein methyltransferase CheR